MRTFSKVSLNFLAAACLALSLVACGDDDSSSGYVHKNDTSASCGVDDENCECEDDDCDVSSSSKKTAASSSAKEKNDSSSAKSSFSVNSSAGGSSAKSSSSGKNTSASSSAGGFSSSLPKELQCLVECTEACEGETYWHGSDYQMICHGGQWLNLDSMEQANAPSSSSYFDMTEHFNPDVEYGEFTDPRDGKKYRTVTIDYKYHMRGVDSVTIFAENLNFGKMIAGGTVQGDSTKYCYDDDPWYCENGWGGLYTWSNAMGFPAVCDSVSIASEKCPNKFDLSNENENFNGDVLFTQHQGICPEGWHVMNEDIWTLLSEMSGQDVSLYMGSKIAGFGNKNLYGISLLPAGYWNPAALEYGHISNSALYWLPRQYPEYDDCAYRVAVRTNEFNKTFRGLKTQGFSVRCVKNY